MNPLDEWVHKLDQAGSQGFFQIREGIISWMKDRPLTESIELLDGVKEIRSRIAKGEVRWEWIEPFVYGLISRSEPRYAEVLGEIMLDDSLHMTEELAEVLGDLGESAQGAVPALEDVLRSHSDPACRSKAAYSLGQIGASHVWPVLASALSDEASSVRRESVLALGRLGAVSLAPQILELLKDDPDDLVRAVAARTLGRWKVTAARPLLIELAARETEPTLVEALRAALLALTPSDNG